MRICYQTNSKLKSSTLMMQINTGCVICKAPDFQFRIRAGTLDPELDRVVLVKVPNGFCSACDGVQVAHVLAPKALPGKTVHKLGANFRLLFFVEEEDVLSHSGSNLVFLGLVAVA